MRLLLSKARIASAGHTAGSTKLWSQHLLATQEPWLSMLEAREFGDTTPWSKGPRRGFKPPGFGGLHFRLPEGSPSADVLSARPPGPVPRGRPGKKCSNQGPRRRKRRIQRAGAAGGAGCSWWWCGCLPVAAGAAAAGLGLCWCLLHGLLGQGGS